MLLPALLCLDFYLPSRSFKVQSTTFPHSVWTFSHCLTTSKSNPPHFYTSFGLPPASTPLQGPIRHTLALRLDFLRVSHYFKVQSSPTASRFWTSSVPHTTLKSNPQLQLPGTLQQRGGATRRPFINRHNIAVYICTTF